MAFADPQSVTYNAVAESLPRVQSGSGGAFASSDREFTLEISHEMKNRKRDTVVLKRNIIVADPLVPSQNSAVGQSVRLTIDSPITGMTNTDALNLANALVAWATSGQLQKLIGLEV